MSGVVLRCPTCGTTQGTPGECEACFEGTVRYFCDNHAPGRWLDAPVCDACGATVGKAAPKGPRPSSPAAPKAPADRRRGSGTVRPPASSREPTSAGPRRPPSRKVEIEDAPAAPSLSDLLAHLAAERDRAPLELDEPPPPRRDRELPSRAPFLGGCLLRLLLLVLLVIVLAVTGLLVLLGGLFQ